MRCNIFMMTGALLGGLLCAGSGLAAGFPAKDRCDQCLAKVQADPSVALMTAGAWAKNGGGAAADHCAALALVGLRRYAEAGAKLDSLACGNFAADTATRLALFD